MIPRSVVGNLPNSMVGQIQFMGNGVNWLSLEELPDLSNIIFGQFRHVALFAACVIGHVLMLVEIGYVFGAIVQAIVVDVVNIMPFGTRADESKRNKFMHIPFSALIALEEPQVIVAILHAERFIFGVVGLCIAVFGGYALRNSFDLSCVANLVQVFIARYIAPLFKCKLELGIAWSMLFHVGSLLTTISLIRRRVDARWPVLSFVLQV